MQRHVARCRPTGYAAIASLVYGTSSGSSLLTSCTPGVQPEIVIPRIQDDRHPVVDGADKLVRVGGQDGTGVDGAVAPLPMLPVFV